MGTELATQQSREMRLGAFVFSPVGLSIEGQPTIEDWADCGQWLNRAERMTHWYIGDWVNYGENRYGEGYSQYLDACGFSYQTVATDAWVAKAFAFSRRRENLSFSHHTELAALEPAEQGHWLDRADQEGWSRNRLRQELRQAGVRLQPDNDNGMAVHYSSESAEWHTPPEIIERTQRLFGRIDLDPCSNSGDNPNVPAAYCYTREDDGLAQQWAGRVYMNPPYGRVIGDWTSKLVEEYEAGRVSEAIALVPARVDTDWWRGMRDSVVCFIDGRLRFSGMDNSAPFPSAVVYFGNNVAGFSAAFGDMGDVWVRWHDPGTIKGRI